ncbi:porin family protein [Mucilaginibacter myungsuensis]|uniref:PorT family protein n=1 Tax=Mucilaginibacter myungsuensis TaxID=649104 RepID=A0A929KSX8_9SPHI|nr:porin family protein [Mucilaginibacter myungsuensis]MBE9660582.1 PorT family protein [Mucilaginibacter myungsuensis]MDN3600626.1 porin family protein [Mucilaginibacter myungsuensis]
MKKSIFILSICLLAAKFSSAQLLPSFQFGAKAGVNLSSFSTNSSALAADNRAGYLVGAWARVGAIGFHFQPELYLTSKSVNVSDGSNINKATFTSIDVPLLFGSKIGAFGFGGRFYTGPLVSFAVNKDQSTGTALGNISRLNYKDQNLAWTAGAGLDIKKISVDLRYEYGLSKQSYGNNESTRVNLFNLTVAYSLFSF